MPYGDTRCSADGDAQSWRCLEAIHTAPRPSPPLPQAKAGFARAWNFQHPTAHITALGVKKCAAGEGRPINGVCTPIAGADGDGDGAQEGEAKDATPQLPKAVLEREVGRRRTPAACVALSERTCVPHCAWMPRLDVMLHSGGLHAVPDTVGARGAVGMGLSKKGRRGEGAA